MLAAHQRSAIMFSSWFSRQRPSRLVRRKCPARSGIFRPGLEGLEDRTLLSTTATHFLLLAPQVAQAGLPAHLDVVALDAANHRVWDSTGTVHFGSSNSADKLPGDYTFQASDHGEADFTLMPAGAAAR
jgi:hypothetical protein